MATSIQFLYTLRSSLNEKKQTPRFQNVNHEQFAIPRYSIGWSSEKIHNLP